MELSDRKIKRPGSVRLTDAQYKEMEELGFESESAYVKHKMNDAQKHLKIIKQDSDIAGFENPKTPPSTGKMITKEALDLQRLEIENQQLRDKMEELMQVKDQALNGVHQQVGNLLKDELQRRDFEQLKKDHANKIKELEKLEATLKKTEIAVEEKEEEIKGLLKKLSFIELGKVLLPGAINGLAKRFPKQMHGLASTLGAITDGADALPAATGQGLSEEQQNLLQIVEYFRELFDEKQFEQLVQLVMQMGETIKSEPELFQKISYYLKKLQEKENNQKPDTQNL